jgi:DNA-binding NtrC family response regulator
VSGEKRMPSSLAQKVATLPEKPADRSPERVVTVLAISPYDQDHAVLRNIFSHSNWCLRSARTWREAQTSLAANPASVVLCEACLSDAEWQDVLAGIESMPGRPLLVVTSSLADDRLWAEVLNLGGYDVLMKPFEQSEVVRVLSLAWLNWRDKRGVAGPKAPAAMSRPRLAAAAGA